MTSHGPNSKSPIQFKNTHSTVFSDPHGANEHDAIGSRASTREIEPDRTSHRMRDQRVTLHAACDDDRRDRLRHGGHRVSVMVARLVAQAVPGKIDEQEPMPG